MTDARRSQSGTSLLELLVAVALLALLAVYALDAIGSLRDFGHIETRLGAQQSVDAAAGYIRGSIESMRPARVENDGAPPRLAFSGAEKEISFVTESDPRLDYGGLYDVNLVLEKSADGLADLVAYRRPFRAIKSSATASLLLQNIERLTFRYFGSPEEGEPFSWREQWNSPSRLPLAVEIDVRFARSDSRRHLSMTIGIMTAR